MLNVIASRTFEFNNIFKINLNYSKHRRIPKKSNANPYIHSHTTNRKELPWASSQKFLKSLGLKRTNQQERRRLSLKNLPRQLRHQKWRHPPSRHHQLHPRPPLHLNLLPSPLLHPRHPLRLQFRKLMWSASLGTCRQESCKT